MKRSDFNPGDESIHFVSPTNVLIAAKAMS
jgi:hypothetical protein